MQYGMPHEAGKSDHDGEEIKDSKSCTLETKKQ